MNTRLRLIITLCTTPSFILTLIASSMAGSVELKTPLEVPSPLYPGTVITGMKTSDAYTEGNFSIVAPVWSSLGSDEALNGDYLFLEPYVSWGEGGEVASSLGFGWRHLFGAQSMKALTDHDGHQAGVFEEGVFIGANAFIDMLDTETNHQFWQLGIGAEIGTRYLELRGNYYLTLTEKQEVERFRTKENYTSSKTSYSTNTTGADPFATGNTIQQNYTQTTFATTSTRTTTIERLFRRYEEGMEGWDAEIALLVPWIDRYMDVKVIGGYYAFDNQPFGPQSGGAGNVEGWKAGLEIRPVPALVLNGTWYEDERLTGSDWTVGVQMQIPFEAGDLGDGKNFWSRIGDSFKPRRRHLIERVAEPVRRQNTAVRLAGSVDEDEGRKKTTSTVKRVTRVVAQSGGQLVLADDVVFVNNGAAVGNGIQAGSAAGNGTAESPVDTIQTGANLAQTQSNATARTWNVYTQGTAGGYTGNVTANVGSVNFIGSGRAFAGVGGKSFGTGPMPWVNGSFKAIGIPYFGITTYHVDGSAGDAIGMDDVASSLVDGNLVTNAGDIAISVHTSGNTAAVVDIRNNITSNAFSYGILLSPADSSSITGLLTGNATGGGASGIGGFSYDSGSLNITAIGNTIDSPTQNGFDLSAASTAPLIALIQGNVINQPVGDGIFTDTIGSSKMTVEISGNTIVDPGVFMAGIHILSEGTAQVNATVSGNSISQAGDAILLESDDTSQIISTVEQNVLTQNANAGINLQTNDGSYQLGLIDNNLMTGSGNFGIRTVSLNTSTLKAGITKNTVLNTTSNAIYIEVLDAGSTGILLANNTVTNSGKHGLTVVNEDVGAPFVTVTFDGNSFTNTGFSGVSAVYFTQSSGNININGTENNLVGPPANAAFRLESSGNPAGTIILNGANIVLPVDAP
ncbi:hypothetical protein BH11VER1_BH11VER1_26670 [soil metagenome]